MRGGFHYAASFAKSGEREAESEEYTIWGTTVAEITNVLMGATGFLQGALKIKIGIDFNEYAGGRGCHLADNGADNNAGPAKFTLVSSRLPAKT
jgi:hypothetical protein